MSKNNNNTLKNPKSTHKRNNSNSYTSTTSNINSNFSNIITTNQSELINTTNNIGNNTITQNLFNLNKTQNQNNRDPNVTSQLGNLNSSNLNINQNTVDLTKNVTFTHSSSFDDVKSLQQKIECVGKVPSARFGHTIVLVSPVKIILFGGAVGDTRNFQFTNDTYVLNLITKIWMKLEVSGLTVPCARAAHAACSNDNLQMVVYGGSTGSGMLAGDELYILDHKVKDEEANWSTWSVIPTTGKTPGKRYGHTLCYMKPYIVLFGGNTGSQPANDTWILNLDKSPFAWSKLEILDDSQPSSRLYHAAGLCTKGNAQGMMIIFGGRDGSENALNDSWGLRRHRNGNWDWVQAPYKSEAPKQRYNVF